MAVTSELKAEAKRLRSAVADMFNVNVSVSQSLELIAKTKNFPNWDALSACAIATDPPSSPSPWLSYSVPRITYTDILESDILSHQLLIHGTTGSGKTRLALKASGILARRFSASVVLVSPNQECRSEHFISSADPDLEYKLDQLGYENMVLVLDEVQRLGAGPAYWFGLGRKAKAVVITMHTSALHDLPGDCRGDEFQRVPCDRSVQGDSAKSTQDNPKWRVTLTILHGGTAEDRARERYRRSEQLERAGKTIILVEEPPTPSAPSAGVIPGYTTIPKKQTINDAVSHALLLDPDWIAIDLTSSADCVKAITRAVLTGHNVLCTTDLKIDTNTIARQIMVWMQMKKEDFPHLEVFDCTDWANPSR